MTGISKTSLGYFQNNQRSPRLDQLEKIAAALNVTLYDLFDSKYK